MFLRLFKGAQPALFAFVPVFAVMLWLKYLIVPMPAEVTFEPNPMPLYSIVAAWLEGYEIISRLITLVLIIVVSLWLSRLNTKFIILGSRSYLPTFLFLIIVSGFQPLQQMNPAIFACLLLVYSIEIMYETFKKEGLALRFFQAAFLVSLASLFYARSAYFMLVVWTGLIILRPFRWREWVFSLLGFFLPYIFLFSIHYLAGQSLQENWDLIMENFLPDHHTGLSNLYYVLFYGFILLLIIAATLRMLRINQGLKNYIRKFYRLNFWVFVFTLAVYFLLFSRSIEFIYFLAVPVSYILTHYLYNMRSRLAGEIIAGLLLSLYGLILIFN